MKSDKLHERKTLMDEDISFHTPSLNKVQQEENLSAFGIYRRNAKNKISDKDKLRLRLLRLKHQINHYLGAQESDHHFGFFLELYMNSLDLTGKSFAEEISIQPSELSQILHNRRSPNEKIMVRLEIHSNYNFPAFLWYEVLAKQKALELKKDKTLRRQEEANVQPKVGIVL